jgi:transcriptional regulator with XRE-family HTH domain
VDSKTQIREFLTSRRAKITPDRAGLPVYGGQRRVPGLRREKVALLAGVSVDYYTRLERGNVNGVSDSVLEALANSARYIFLDPRATSLDLDWDRVANDAVAILRSEAGRNPYDRDLSDLVGELSTRSDLFRTLWAKHNVRFHDTGAKRLHHPVVGDLELTYETMQLAADPGLMLFAYTAEPGTRSAQALDLLASWGATPQQVQASEVADEA